MKILILVNESPWGSTLAATALRFARAVMQSGGSIEAIYFRGDGIYNALPGEQTDPGAEELSAAWTGLAAEGAFPLLLCSAALVRRFPESFREALPAGFHEAGLAQVLERQQSCSSTVNF